MFKAKYLHIFSGHCCECYYIARYFNGVYNCVYDELKRQCDSATADFYGNVFVVSTEWLRSANNSYCAIGNN